METIIDVSDLTCRYGRTLALDTVSMHVARGRVFGLVGENGAGKTTLIQHLLGLIRPQHGTVRVFGMNPVSHPAQVLGRIGIVTEDRDLPAWMRVDELMNFTRSLYPAWDLQYATELRKAFGLDGSARVGTLSQGQLAKAGLLVALAHRPELLVLDEPSSGLDPVVRRDILEAIICTVAESGRTVVFSSHLLDEVERVADHIAMLKSGRMVLNEPLDQVKDGHHRVTVRARNGAIAPKLPGTISRHGDGPEWTYLCHGNLGRIVHAVHEDGAEVLFTSTPTLDEIFVARCTMPCALAGPEPATVGE